MYVVNYGSGTVTPISTATNKAGRAIRVGTDPESIAFSANGETAVVANEGSNSDTEIDTATGASSTAPVGNAPVSVLIEVIVPSHGVTLGDVATICDNNGTISYNHGYLIIWFDEGGSFVPPVGGNSSDRDELAAQQDQRRRIPLGKEPGPMAFSPSNRTIYVVNEGSGDVTPVVI